MSKWSLLREFYGLSLDDVAKEIGMTKQAVSKFENNDIEKSQKKSKCEEFYNHKVFYRLFKNKYGDLEPIMEYVDFVLQSVDFEELKKDNDKIYVDTDSNFLDKNKLDELLVDGEFYQSEEYKELKAIKESQNEDNYTLEEMPFN